jgi:hypothetical protein
MLCCCLWKINKAIRRINNDDDKKVKKLRKLYNMYTNKIKKLNDDDKIWTELTKKRKSS